MTFNTVASFSKMRSDLEESILAAAMTQAEKAGIGPLDKNRLAQMSISLADVAGELLMFGCNAWPLRESDIAL